MPPRSRATRNQDAAARSRQGQALDIDPMDGLPVQRYTLMTVKMNQDAAADASTTNAKSTDSPEWAAQFGTAQYPWAEAPVPAFYNLIKPHNQELIRRARVGNTNAKLSVWDRQNNCWMSAAEAEKRATPLKSLHLNNLPTDGDTKMGNGDDASQKSDDDEDHGSSNESNKSADDDDEDADESAPFNIKSSKRRKLASRQNADDTRLLEVKRWVHMPASQADNLKERSFLAPRRPGMPPLYQPEYVQKMFGQYHSSSVIAGTAGYDLGDGGGLSNASGVLNAGTEAGGAATPRKNIPPRRKKKKLGGPGRRKANPQPIQQIETVPVDGAAAPTDTPMQGVESTDTPSAAKPDGAEGDDAEGNESGSEAEGSEEGEIDQSGGTRTAIQDEPIPIPPLISATVVVPITEPEPKPAPEPEPEPQTQPEPQPELGTQTQPELETQTQLELETQTQPELQSVLEQQPTQLSEPQADTRQQPEAEPELPQEPKQALVAETLIPAEPQPELLPFTEDGTKPELTAEIQAPELVPSPQPVPVAVVEEVTKAPTPEPTGQPTPVGLTTEAIPGLGLEDPAKDPEERQIIEEDAKAIATEPKKEEIPGISEALTDVAQASDPKPADGELDLLGAMDAAIDQGMNGEQ